MLHCLAGYMENTIINKSMSWGSRCKCDDDQIPRDSLLVRLLPIILLIRTNFSEDESVNSQPGGFWSLLTYLSDIALYGRVISITHFQN